MTKGFFGWRCCELWRVDWRGPRGHRAPTACRSLREAWRSVCRSACIFKQQCSRTERCSRTVDALTTFTAISCVARLRSARTSVMGVSALRGGSGSQCEARRGTPPAECAVKAEPPTELRETSSVAASTLEHHRQPCFSWLLQNRGYIIVILAQKNWLQASSPFGSSTSGFGWQTRTTLHRKLIRHRRSQTSTPDEPTRLQIGGQP